MTGTSSYSGILSCGTMYSSSRSRHLLLVQMGIVTISVFIDLLIILVTLAGLGVFSPPCQSPAAGKKNRGEQPKHVEPCLQRVCYFPGWAQFRKGPDRFLPENLNGSLCSHIHYAYANLSGNHLQPLYPNDINVSYPTRGMYFRINALKRRHMGLKTLVSVGGWREGSASFSRMVSTADSRQQFAETAVRFVDGYGFDGLDLHWEFPADRGSSPGDREKFTSLVQQLRKTFDDYSAGSRPTDTPLLLTAAVAPGNEQRIENAYELDTLHGLLDYMSIMTFDLHGPWQNVTGHISPLYSSDMASVVWAAEYYSTQALIPRSKLLLGISTYGRSFTLADPSNAVLGAPAEPRGVEVRGTEDDGGVLAYFQICKMGGQRKRDEEQKVPYLVNDKQLIVYDDKESVADKANYVKEHGYGGVVVWTPALDDFTGSKCGQGPYPLLTTVADTICSQH